VSKWFSQMKHALLTGFVFSVWLVGAGSPALPAEQTNVTRLAVVDGGMVDTRIAAAPVTLTVLKLPKPPDR